MWTALGIWIHFKINPLIGSRGNTQLSPLLLTSRVAGVWRYCWTRRSHDPSLLLPCNISGGHAERCSVLYCCVIAVFTKTLPGNFLSKFVTIYIYIYNYGMINSFTLKIPSFIFWNFTRRKYILYQSYSALFPRSGLGGPTKTISPVPPQNRNKNRTFYSQVCVPKITKY
jgi:hypothetical protein